MFLSEGHTWIHQECRICTNETALAKIKTIFKQTYCLNVRPADKYWMQEKGKYTMTTKPHILDDDVDLRSHMPCQGKVLTFNIGGLKQFWGKWSLAEPGEHKKKPSGAALRCTSEEAAERKPHFLAGVAADMPHRPRWDILSPQTTYRISGTRGAGVYGCPSHTLLEEKSLLTFMKQPFRAHSGQRFHRLRRLLCWCLWGSKMWKLPSGMHQIELERC